MDDGSINALHICMIYTWTGRLLLTSNNNLYLRKRVLYMPAYLSVGGRDNYFPLYLPRAFRGYLRDTPREDGLSRIVSTFLN